MVLNRIKNAFLPFTLTTFDTIQQSYFQGKYANNTELYLSILINVIKLYSRWGFTSYYWVMTLFFYSLIFSIVPCDVSKGVLYKGRKSSTPSQTNGIAKVSPKDFGRGSPRYSAQWNLSSFTLCSFLNQMKVLFVKVKNWEWCAVSKIHFFFHSKLFLMFFLFFFMNWVNLMLLIIYTTH